MKAKGIKFKFISGRVRQKIQYHKFPQYCICKQFPCLPCLRLPVILCTKLCSFHILFRRHDQTVRIKYAGGWGGRWDKGFYEGGGRVLCQGWQTQRCDWVSPMRMGRAVNKSQLVQSQWKETRQKGYSVGATVCKAGGKNKTLFFFLSVYSSRKRSN